MSSIVDIKCINAGLVVKEDLFDCQYRDLKMGTEFEDEEGNRWLLCQNERGRVCAAGLSEKIKGQVHRYRFSPATRVKAVRRLYQ